MKGKLNARDLFDHEIPKLLPEKPEVAKRINAVVGIELTGEDGGYWTLDLTENLVVERGRTKEPKCTIIAHTDDFEALLAGGSVRDLLQAFKEKRLQTSGHLPTILKLEGLLTSYSKMVS